MKYFRNHRFPVIGNQKGIALVMVLVLSAIGLGLMTALIYMVMTGTQVSGLQKRYKTSLEAGMGGKDIVIQVLSRKDHYTEIQSYITGSLTGSGILSSITTPTTCTYTTAGGVTYSGLQTKLMTASTAWTTCTGWDLAIDPGDATTYDMTFQLGVNPQYMVYAKIVDTVPGSDVGESTGLRSGGVVDNKGEIQGSGVANLYTIDILTQNSANASEKSMLQLLYQY